MFSVNATPQGFFQARIFVDPLVPVGPDPSADENTSLASALQGYENRSGPDDFSSLTGFLDAHPTSSWSASLLTNLGLEYYNTGHYSKTMEVWRRAWELANGATDLMGRAVANRAVGELAFMYGRLGRVEELEALLESVKDREFSGPATEKISGARHGLSAMRTQPEISFRCGPLALYRIKLSIDPQNPGTELIHASESTPAGFSLAQAAELSCRLGLHFQTAFRNRDAEVVVPSVVHLKVDHFAAIVRKEGVSYLLQDPTFTNDVWVTREALDSEGSGYSLVPHGELPTGWRTVGSQEAGTVWGKGNVPPVPAPPGPCDPHSGGGNPCDQDEPCKGLAVPRVHLLSVSLNINDEPVGYSPPVGPPVRFTVRYNQRDSVQPSIFRYSNFGPKWTFDWMSYITDHPASPSADVTYYIMGGGARTFTGFDTGTQSFAFQQFDQTKLTRTARETYEMLSPDGSRKIFGQSDGATGTSRNTFLTQLIDRFGNAVTLTYDANLRVSAITDAIGQVTTISYDSADILKITKVTDPFGRFATFAYDGFGRLQTITDVMGMTSEFTYEGRFSDFITALKTPYGVTSFTKSEIFDRRSLETLYPDGNRDRVEFRNQDPTGHPVGIAALDPTQSLPTGMTTTNEFLQYRNTYYWSKIAYAAASEDYTKAKIYHWLHTTDLNWAAGILESVKEPLEGRVWHDYAGQPGGLRGSIVAGKTNKPSHTGRVLDDGSTQLYSYEYNDFGNVIRMIDPVGRTFSYIYDANGIDLLETRQTRAGQNELLSRITYNAQHLPLTSTDAAGQTTTYTYNARGQVLTKTNAKSETTTYNYDANGNLTSIDGPLPGSNDSVSFTYDSFGRVRTKTDESGYTLTFNYDALDRLTKITFPDSTFDQFTYTLLDRTLIQDRAGRQTSSEYDKVRQMTRRTDPLNRTTLFQWCKCGDLKGLTDPMGRTTTWGHDVQGRLTHKQYVDGSRVTYRYEQTTSRISQRIDEKLQVTQYHYYRDNTLRDTSYTNAIVATPAVTFSYDPDYNRVRAMTDGTGTTRYGYHPVSPNPGLGAGSLASIDGPLGGNTVAYIYDELGRPIETIINGAATNANASVLTLDEASRIIAEGNPLGLFGYAYDGATKRLLSARFPNGQTATFNYLDEFSDQRLERITYSQTATPISEFRHAYDVPAGRMTTWSQKSADQMPIIYAIGYDAGNQLTSVARSQNGSLVGTFQYSYDAAGNRLTEQIDGAINAGRYNALNEVISMDPGLDTAAGYEWDAEHRLTAVNAGRARTEFTYDGLGRRVGIRQLVSGVVFSDRRFLWCADRICEEQTSNGETTKRYFEQGMQIEAGAAAGLYYYTRDHLGSIRELTDSSGTVRTRYSYDPFGRRTRAADPVATPDPAEVIEADFGFAGMFFPAGVNLNLTKFRAYDPTVGRWLSRDPLGFSEVTQGPNLYSYVSNDPINLVDRLGLCCETEQLKVAKAFAVYAVECSPWMLKEGKIAAALCLNASIELGEALEALHECAEKECTGAPPPCPNCHVPPPPPAPPPGDPDIRCVEVSPCNIACFIL